jgi:hypothetical protein
MILRLAHVLLNIPQLFVRVSEILICFTMHYLEVFSTFSSRQTWPPERPYWEPPVRQLPVPHGRSAEADVTWNTPLTDHDLDLKRKYIVSQLR